MTHTHPSPILQPLPHPTPHPPTRSFPSNPLFPPTVLPPSLHSTTILPSANPFGSTASNTLGLTSMSSSAHPSHVSTIVAEYVVPVVGLRIWIAVPQSGLSLGFGGFCIMGTERATMASVAEEVRPQEPRPGGEVVRGGLGGWGRGWVDGGGCERKAYRARSRSCRRSRRWRCQAG